MEQSYLISGGMNAIPRLDLRPVTENPMLLVDERDNNLILIQETLNWIQRQEKMISVISILGPTGLGKSYLLNKFMKREGFRSDNNLDGTTKGVWIWGFEHPWKTNEIVLFMDTEGQCDVERNEGYDMKIALLVLLLSSVIVFNISKKIGSNLIQQLGNLAQLSRKIRMNEVDDANIDQLTDYLPSLIVLIRDFQSNLQFQGSHITPDLYLEMCLDASSISIDSVSAQNTDQMRRLINFTFPKRKRFGRILPCPFSSIRLPEDLPSFERGMEELKHLMLFLCHPKTLQKAGTINGRYFSKLIERYVHLLNNGNAVCIRPTFDLIINQEREHHITEGIALYEEMMNQLSLPISPEDFLARHTTISKIVMENIMSKIVFDNTNSFLETFQIKLAESYQKMAFRNERESYKKCKEILTNLHQSIETKLQRKEYFCPNGYQMYKEDMDRLKEQYQKFPDKGSKDDSTFMEFTSEKEFERTLVIKADNQMTELKIREEMRREKEEESKLQMAQMEKDSKEQQQRMSNLIKQIEEMREVFAEEQFKRQQFYEEQMEKQRLQLEKYHQTIKEQMNTPWNNLLGTLIKAVTEPIMRFFQKL